jgi:hypothetical protein
MAAWWHGSIRVYFHHIKMPHACHLIVAGASSGSLHFFHDLHYVFVLQEMVLAHSLRPVLARGTPHQRMLEVFHDGLVDTVAKVLNSALVPLQHNRVIKVRKLPLGFGVHPAPTRTP